MCGSASTRSTTPAAASDRIAAPNAGSRSGSSASKHTVRPASEVVRALIGSCSRIAASSSSVPTTRNTGAPDRETGLPRAAHAPGRGSGRGCPERAPERPGRAGCGALHDRVTLRDAPTPPPPSRSPARARAPRDRACGPRGRRRARRPGRALPTPRSRTASGPPITISPAAFGSRGRAARATGTVATRPDPFLHALGAAAADPERSRAAGGAAPGSLTDDAADRTLRGPQHAAARSTRCGRAARLAHLRDPVPGHRGIDERPPRDAQRLHQARRAPLGARAHHLDLGPPSLRRGHAPRSPSAAASLVGQAAARTHTAPGELRASDRDVAHVVVGSAFLTVRRMRLARHPHQPDLAAAARIPPAVSPPPRRTPRRGSPTTSGTASAHPHPRTRTPDPRTPPRNAVVVAGRGDGLRHQHQRPPPPLHARPHRLHQQAPVHPPAQAAPRTPPPPSAAPLARSDPRNTDDHSGGRCAEDAGERPGGSDRGEAEGRSEAPPGVSPVPSACSCSSPATRGGDNAPSTVANGVTYRSAIQRASSSIEASKYRTGETAFITGSIRAGISSVGPSTQPRVSLPWNRKRT